MSSSIVRHRVPVLAGLFVAPLLIATTSPAAPKLGPPDSELLVRYMETALHAWQTPGGAIAIVKDDRVVLVRGIGWRETGRPELIDADTLFPIASLTKGFTATLAAVEIAAGRLAWDQRVSDVIPGFRVADPWLSRELRLDDLLSHRTGWQPEVDYLWMEGLVTAEILARIPHVAQGERFRGGYSYLNVPYLVAGEAIARAAGKPYPTLVRERLLEPLGMSATRTSAAEFAQVANRITPHSDLAGAPHAVALDDGDGVAPAAGLHSTATDMARWLRFHLGDGSLDGHPLLSPEQLADLHEPQTLIPRGDYLKKLYPSTHFQAYARGWVVQDYLGRGLIWNTGGLYGTACSIALVPEERLGVIVMTNGPRISLPEAIVFRTLDAWLGAPPRDWAGERLTASLASRARATAADEERRERLATAPAPRLPIADYAGRYHAPLLGDLDVRVVAGQLRVSLGELAGAARPWGNDAFLIRFDNPFYGTSLITFALDAEAKPVRADVEDVGHLEAVRAKRP